MDYYNHSLPNSNALRYSKFHVYEIGISILAIMITFVTTSIVVNEGSNLLGVLADEERWIDFSGHAFFLFVIGCLVYGGMVFLVTRTIYYYRCWRHIPASQDELNQLINNTDSTPYLTILVPAYKEEEKTIYQTLMSAALQHHNKKRIVLLLDDPPQSKSLSDQKALIVARSIPLKIQRMLDLQKKPILTALTQLNKNCERNCIIINNEKEILLGQIQSVALWFADQAQSYPVSDHADRAFVENIFEKHFRMLIETQKALKADFSNLTSEQVVVALRQEYKKLAAIFTVDISSFERKQFENLSHEPNKAMNLNSYIGLLGKNYKIISENNKTLLRECDALHCELSIPDSEFIITLDADSIVVPDYALRLIHVMQQKDNSNLAVVQTPYSAFPGATGALERVAGATTDMQYIIHQGFTGLNGTYWVGANALIRKSALEDIVTTSAERGHVVKRYIQDRTVIEDTESSVDLAEKGWRLFNYPERMAYSATPPDFGSLIIQRQRWANGGLIILPKLLRYLVKGPISLFKLGEAFVRIHYLVSIALVNIGLVIILAFPIASELESYWLPIMALGYFWLYARDLKLIGYRYSDMLRVYALTLLLIPVNIAGVFKSLQQAWTGEQIPFVRTPKVAGRTTAPAIFIYVLCGLAINWFVTSYLNIVDENWFHAIFALVNALMMLYAIVALIGIQESWQGLTLGSQISHKTSRKKLYRLWLRINRKTINILGNTP